MTVKSENLNTELYSGELFDDWANRKGLIPAEEWLIKKYLTDTAQPVLEGGTGGGRISFQIEKLGFTNISAFDFVPEMIAHANAAREKNGSNVQFQVQDATDLSAYGSDSFYYLIYLQQVLCFIDKEDLFHNALVEAYRIAKKDGIVIFSFLDFNTRAVNKPLSVLINFVRRLRNQKMSSRYLPWLKINAGFNWRFLGKKQPITFWVEKNKVVPQLERIGFTVLEAKNENQLKQDEPGATGMLYVVCKK